MSDNFNFQPTLKGEKLLLTPLLSSDYERLYEVASDPLIWAGHPATDRYLESQFKTFFADAMASGGTLLACDRQSGAAIGSSRFFPYECDSDQIEIGWSFLARSRWGGVYNGEMKRLMMDHIFRTHAHVYFRVGDTNVRSQKAVLKIGAVQIGTSADGQGAKWIHYRCDRDQ